MGQNLRYSPLEWDEKLKIFNFGGYGATGLLLEALTTTGNVFYVDNGNKQAFNGYGDWGRSPSKPLASIDWAIGRCTANNGDIIVAMPGHAENVSTAAAITFDIAGVKLIGIGEGAARPTLTFNSADNSAYVLISAASVGIYNILGVCGDDGLTKAFYVTGADCTLDITWRDPANVEAARCILGGTGADRIKIKLKYEGDAATGNACVAPIQLNGTNEGDIFVDFYGIASTAVVNFITTACTGIRVNGHFYNNGTTNLSKNVVDTEGNGLWSVHGFDGSAGCWFSGGDNTAVAKDDLSVVASDMAVLVSDWATFDSSVSDLTILASDLTATISDLNLIVSDVSSDLAAIETKATTIASDLVILDTVADKVSSDLIVTQSDVKAIGSDLIVTNAIVDKITSDLIIVDTVVDKVSSDLIVVMSDVKAINSDVIVLATAISDLESDLTVIEEYCSDISSDLRALKGDVSDLYVLAGVIEAMLSDFVVKYTSDNP